MNWRRWPWYEQAALPLAVMLLRICWLWPWLLLLARWTMPPEMRPFLPLSLVLALMLGGAITARLIPVNHEHLWRARAQAIFFGLTAMWLALWWRVGRADSTPWDMQWVSSQAMAVTHWRGTFPLPVAVLGLSAFLWLRGMQDSSTVNHDRVWRSFTSGFLALVAILVVGRMDPDGTLPGLAKWIVMFFAVGMTALALSGLRLARGVRHSSAPPAINRYWLTSIVAVVLVLIAVGSTLAIIITPDGVQQIMSWLGRVASWFGLILGYLLYAVAFVIFFVLSPLINWLEKLVSSWPRVNTEDLQQMQRGLQEMTEQPSTVTVPPAVDESMRWVFVIAAVLLVAVAFSSALYLLRKRNTEVEDEVRETILTRELLRDQADSLWQRWRRRLARNAPVSVAPYLLLSDVQGTRRRIRSVYQEFLSAMSARDIVRARGESPSRFAQRARRVLPAEGAAMAALAEKYNAARYGDVDPTIQNAEEAEMAWSTIRTELESFER